MIYIVALLWVLGILIFAHELGHFLVAKLAGVKVLKFSIGFGPKLIGKKIGETEYMISALPLGGYVKLLGDNPGEKVSNEEEDRAFLRQPTRTRMAIVAAGPLSNFLLAIFIFSLLFWTGMPQPSSVVGEVADGFPAHTAGIWPGDKIVKVNDVEITYWSDILTVIPKSGGKELRVIVKRRGEIIRFSVTPRAVTTQNIFGDEIKTYQIGIMSSKDMVILRDPLFKAIGNGFYQTWFITKVVIVSIVKIIQRASSIKKALGGPILIAQAAGEQAQEGFLYLVFFTAALSVNLGLINLFPIPILDGGHLLFLGIETITRRPLSVKKMELAQKIGLFIIILLMVFIIYNDIMRIIPQGTK